MRGTLLRRVGSGAVPLLGWIVWLALVPSGARAQRSAGDTAADAAAIRRLIQAHADAWNRRDARAAAAAFHPDADVRLGSGRYLRGRAAIEQGHEAALKEDSAAGGTVHSHPPSTIRLRFVRPDVALGEVEARYDPRSPGPDGKPQPPDRALLFLVLTKEHGRWGVAAQRNLGPPRE
jgi:uncharacterized protein (TIGR02246 family)